MSRNILFTPVGGNDPTSAYNFMDGSIMHICRNFDITDVYMYMSKEMLEYEEKDQRYTKALKHLEDIKKAKFNVEIIERRELSEVQDYDYFYKDFYKEIEKIKMCMSNGDELFLNISSGTPAMKSALLIIQEIGGLKCKSIQVSTPVKKHNNKKKNDDYDINYALENNPDDKEAINRCKIVKCKNLLVFYNCQKIEEHIRKYNYTSALAIAEMTDEISEDFIKYLKMAYYRSNFQLKKLRDIYINIENEDKKKFLYSYNEDDELCEIVEYILYLDLKIKRKEYLDFIRAISPVLEKLYIGTLKNCGKINIYDYCLETSSKKPNMFDFEKIKGTKMEKVLNINGGPYVKASNLVQLINEYVDDQSVLANIESIRNVEKNVRNVAAHQMIPLGEDDIKELSGNMEPKTIMKLIRKATKNLGYEINPADWNAYFSMNKILINKLKYFTD